MKLLNDLIVLDVESTGVWLERDKVIEVALIKYTPGGVKETFYSRINPKMAIPAVVQKLTGITDDDVKDAPVFRDVAAKMLAFLGTADLGGFNLEKFDLPVLAREFNEAGLKFEWKDRKIYDAQKVFHINEKRDLSAAYKFYCDKDLEGAHSALVDSQAVYDILSQQVEKYGEGIEELTVLDKFEYTSLMEYYDSDRKFCWRDGKLYMTFGKYARKMPLDEIVKNDPGFLRWILEKDFSDSVKKLVRSALDGVIPSQAPARSPVVEKCD